MPAPIAPWMSASEALTIWMLSTAMKAPSVAPATAIQVFVEVLVETTRAAALSECEAEANEAKQRVDCSGLIANSSCSGKWTVRQAACFDNPVRREGIVQRGLIVQAGQD